MGRRRRADGVTPAPRSPIAALGVFALIAFHLVLGRKVYALSKGARTLEDRIAGAEPGGAPRVALG